jgi:hypothetical protein
MDREYQPRCRFRYDGTPLPLLPRAPGRQQVLGDTVSATTTLRQLQLGDNAVEVAAEPQWTRCGKW